MQQMPRKYVANYEQLARKRGYKDPLTYLWERFEAERRRENHEAAIALAMTLLPYGHGKQGQVDSKGKTITATVFKLE